MGLRRRIQNEDGTHNESCADCDYVVAVDCVLGEDYVCSVCGYSWSTVQQTFTYNDYKSQGQPFMNSYTSMGTGITVATKDGSIPYSCSINGTDYYFE